MPRKIRVLYPIAFQYQHEAGDVITVDDNQGENLIRAGYAEEVKPKVERATKAPGEKREVQRKKAED